MKKRKIFIALKSLRIFGKKYIKNRSALLGFITLTFIVFIAVYAPLISPYDPFHIDIKNRFNPPSTKNIMGTDHFGRDLLSRVIWGSRVSLIVGLVSSLISAFIGIILGSIAGYLGGRADELIMRIVEIFMMIPTFFLVLTLAAIFGSSMWNVVLLISITGWSSTARLIRAEFLYLKESPFVEAAKSVGASKTHIIFSEILPNAIFPAIVNTSLQSAGAIMTEASLSFLGLGDPNNVSWGWMINSAMKYLSRGWWLSVLPGLAIIITVISFNLVGDGLNDALNPYLKER